MDNLKIKNNISLRQYTSMHVGGNALYFFEIKKQQELPDLVEFCRKNGVQFFLLGGGSNIIVSDSGFDGLVIKNEIFGIEKINEDENSVNYKVGAGENWDKFVDFCVGQNLFGLENLSHIPGTVGASVVQNIGAYGAEVSSSAVSVDVFDTKKLNFKNLKNEDLDFRYRRSRLNDPYQDKGRYIVTNVYFKLRKNGELNTKYDDLKKYFLERPDLEISLKNLREAVIEVRNKKFPYPDKPENGTVGSFWNADTVSEDVFNKIILKLKDLGHQNKASEMETKREVFKVMQGYKIPYGVLVEALGFRGKKFGNVKILETHAGVINNFSGLAFTKEIVDLSNDIIDKVHAEFGVKLRVEPELVGEFS